MAFTAVCRSPALRKRQGVTGLSCPAGHVPGSVLTQLQPEAAVCPQGTGQLPWLPGRVSGGSRARSPAARMAAACRGARRELPLPASLSVLGPGPLT